MFGMNGLIQQSSTKCNACTALNEKVTFICCYSLLIAYLVIIEDKV